MAFSQKFFRLASRPKIARGHLEGYHKYCPIVSFTGSVMRRQSYIAVPSMTAAADFTQRHM
jgi:hypothetical protein